MDGPDVGGADKGKFPVLEILCALGRGIPGGNPGDRFQRHIGIRRAAPPPLPVALPAQVVVAVGGQAGFVHHQRRAPGGQGLQRRRPAFRPGGAGGGVHFPPFPQGGQHFRQVVAVAGAALGAQVVAVVGRFQQGDAARPGGAGAVEEQDAGLDAGIGLEHPGRQRHDGRQILLYQQLAEPAVGALRLKDDALRHDDAGPPAGRQMLGDVVHEQHLAALGWHRKAPVGADAAFGRHKGRVGQDDLGPFLPTLFAGEGVVFVDLRRRAAMQIEVDPRQPHHIGRNVVALQIGRQPPHLVGRQGRRPAVSVIAVAVAVAVIAGAVAGMGVQNMLAGGDEEPAGAAGRVEDGFILLRVDGLDDEVDDVAGRAELPGVALRPHHGEQILERVAQRFRVVGREFVDDFQEFPQRFRVAERQKGVVEDAAEQRRQAGVFAHPAQRLGVEVQRFLPAPPRADEIAGQARLQTLSPVAAGGGVEDAPWFRDQETAGRVRGCYAFVFLPGVGLHDEADDAAGCAGLPGAPSSGSRYSGKAKVDSVRKAAKLNLFGRHC